jgi:hypothetical protein
MVGDCYVRGEILFASELCRISNCSEQCRIEGIWKMYAGSASSCSPVLHSCYLRARMLHRTSMKCGHLDRSVSIVTTEELGSITGRSRDFRFSTTSGPAHPSFYPVGKGGSFPCGIAAGREADHSPPFITEVKNPWSYTSTPRMFSWRDPFSST